MLNKHWRASPRLARELRSIVESVQGPRALAIDLRVERARRDARAAALQHAKASVGRTGPSVFHVDVDGARHESRLLLQVRPDQLSYGPRMLSHSRLTVTRLSTAAAVVFALVACSTSSTSSGDVATDAGATDAGATTTCGNSDAASKPRCQRGGPCFCDDVGAVSPICVEGAWKCPAGSTRYEDCFGVPPAGTFAECVDAGKADAGNGG